MKTEKDSSTEQSILDAAEKVFLEKGYLKVTTAEIAKEAGINHSLLHYYFRTKENLFNLVFQKKANLLVNSLLTIIQTDLPFLEKIKIGVEAQIDLFADNPKLPMFIFSEMIGNQDRIEMLRHALLPKIAQVEKELASIIGKEVAKGTICPVKPMDLLLNIVSLSIFSFIAQPAVDIIREFTKENQKIFLEERKKSIVNLIIKGLSV
jgi:AcrR family transcriptional regulator